MTNKKLQQILEVGAEGGSLDAYRLLTAIDKNGKPKYVYFWNTMEMDLEDEDGFFATGSNKFNSFEQMLDALLIKYPLLFSLYPLFIHSEYRFPITQKIRDLISEDKLDLSEMYSLETWLEQLKITKYQIDVKVSDNGIDTDLAYDYWNSISTKNLKVVYKMALLTHSENTFTSKLIKKILSERLQDI